MGSLPSDPAPYYRLHVFACTNRRADGHPRGSCAARGAEDLRDYMKKKARELGIDGARINSAGCLDRCELGPTMVIYPEGVWYHYDTPADIDEILTTHVKNGGRVERLMMKPEDGPPKKEKLAAKG
ncbi:MAG TPA: (2Fe-2S) ferredoxin domain-containing protein [Magnetospirillaceae bacterium]|jgi:(2Fe-2S) ferredoxin